MACSLYVYVLDLGRGMEPVPAIGQVRIMINPEEDLPKPSRNLLVPPVLDSFGISELNAYIAALEAEIARVRAKIASKDAHKAAAAAFFKTPG
jgi:uncharacterized small protein (DUF1192 family)